MQSLGKELNNDAVGERSSSAGPARSASIDGVAAGLNTPTHIGDAANDPVEYLNSLYTSEQALLQNLPQLQEAVRDRLSQFDETISLALSRQSEMSDKTLRVLPQALASVKALQHRVLLVKEKAIESEKAVFSITSDMKRLDSAKRHLQRTITTLKRLHMLIHAVEQLRQTTVFDDPKSTAAFAVMDFRSAAQLVEATRLLLEYFDAYTSKVEPMMLLSLNVNKYQNALLQNLKRCFRVVAFGSQKTIELEASTLSGVPISSIDSGGPDEEEARQSLLSFETVPSESDLEGGVLLIDALGEAVRGDFIQGLCQDYLRNYEKDFEPPFRQETATKRRINSFKANPSDNEPAKLSSGLAEMEQRFKWFQDVSQNAIRTFRMVPPRWNLMTEMSRCFLKITRGHVLALLDGQRRDADSENATVLLKSFQKTVVFEKELSLWLEKQCGAVFVAEASKSSSPSQRTTGESSLRSHSSSPHSCCEPLIGIASSAFEDYMGPYIRVEEQSMNEQLAEALEDQSVDTRGERPVFITSTRLFISIKGSITRCTALTKGKPFLQLCQCFQESLRKYAHVLDSKLPGPMAGSSISGISIPASFGQPSLAASASSSGGALYRLAKFEEVKVCHVISTCEYCVETTEALEDLVRDTIDELHSSEIDMSAIQDAFYDVASKAIRVLVSGLTVRAESGLKNFANTNWGSLETVGEESDYVRAMHEEIEPFVVSLRTLLPTSYFRSFCDKFAASFAALYYEIVARLKRISEPGTQQLLLDVYNLKTLFLKLPVADSFANMAENSKAKKAVGGGSIIAPAVYTKMVQNQFGKIETLLKLVGTPNELLIENFKVQWPGGSTAELQVVLALKGLKRVEQVAFLEKLGRESEAARTGTSTTVASAVLVSERVQALQDQGSSVAAKVNSDLSQMKLKVDDFRKTWRGGSN